jgi:hypothetical protein
MHLGQRAYLAVKSTTLSPPEVSAMLGLKPTQAEAMGSRDPTRGIPRCHLWSLASGVDHAASLDDHITALVPILQSHSEALRAVSASESTGIWLTIVRHCEDVDEDFDQSTYGLDPDAQIEGLGGQHPFLGWGMDPGVVELLARCGVGLDVDEYG